MMKMWEDLEGVEDPGGCVLVFITMQLCSVVDGQHEE
jgi:hypothetical protein